MGQYQHELMWCRADAAGFRSQRVTLCFSGRQIGSVLCACLPQVQTLNFVVVRDDAGSTLDTDAYARSWEAFVPKPVLPAGVPSTMPSRGIHCRNA